MVTVAIGKIDMLHRHLGEIDVGHIHVIITDRSNRLGIDAVDMDDITPKITVHVVVEITNDVHTLLLATRCIFLAAEKSHFLATESTIDDAVF